MHQTKHASRAVLAAIATIILAGCGGSDGSTAPVAPSITPPAPASGAMPPPRDAMSQVRQAIADIRAMASDDDLPAAGSVLAKAVQTYHPGGKKANCVDFAEALMSLIAERGIKIQTREFAACLVPNTYDCHTLVEVYTDGDWRLVDPTFGLIPHNAGDSSIATAYDLRTATRAQNWGDITYEFVTPRGASYVTTDYIDWPLYFVNLYVGGQEDIIDGDIEQDVLTKYYIPIGTATTYGSYVLQCPEGQSQGQVIADGVAQMLDCPMLGISHIQPYQSLVPTDGGVVWAPLRHVFQWDGSWPGRP